MNVDTGELRRIAVVGDGRQGSQKAINKLIEEGFTPVPVELEEEANRELGDKESIFVDIKKDSPLANWAKQKRAENKKKARNKMAKESRRRNRS